LNLAREGLAPGASRIQLVQATNHTLHPVT
jgi:hypothetical protein